MAAQIQTDHQKNIGWIHWLRVVASLAVVVIHVCAKDFTIPRPDSVQWQSLNGFESMVRWAVPVFVMISGALLLDPERQLPIKKLFGKYFCRILVVLVFWSFAYALAYTGFYLGAGAKDVLLAAREGYPHLWYLYMLMGLYLVTPLLRPIARSRSSMLYFVLLGTVFGILLPTLGAFDLAGELRYFTSRLEITMVLGYSCYYVLGRLLATSLLTRWQRVLLYMSGIAATGIIALVDGLGSVARGEVFIPLLEPLSLCVFLQSAAIFVFIRQAVGEKTAPTWVKTLSDLSFGIYLIHEVPIDFLRRFCGLSTVTLHPLLSVPLITILSFSLAALITAGIRRIPFLRKTII